MRLRMALPKKEDWPAHSKYGAHSRTLPSDTQAEIHRPEMQGRPSARACIYFAFRECSSAINAANPNPCAAGERTISCPASWNKLSKPSSRMLPPFPTMRLITTSFSCCWLTYETANAILLNSFTDFLTRPTVVSEVAGKARGSVLLSL